MKHYPDIQEIVKYRIESKSIPIPESGCWIWEGAINEDGYGRFVINRKKIVGAHRKSYQAFIGQIPSGMHVLHSCDQPSCVNPKHLFLGNQDINNKDCMKKRRHWAHDPQKKKRISELISQTKRKNDN